ncbi:hypothetical protein [Halalkalibacterium halodurans]|nr:hypothetical protein [Halalkalibacterium halodurans]MDY7224210.1 hypothetical protein [Halalkalibacterium halodurans]MDY7243495.1 hypothetical protein [Halalkalibacterium halodurans]MED4162831.1 hypothetical protein [Halalkalibacterium halodurans]
MKSVFLTLIAASFLFSLTSPQEIQSDYYAEGEFTTQQKPRIGGF